MFCGRVEDEGDTLQRQMHNHYLVHENGCDLIAICTTIIVEEMLSYTYLHIFHMTQEVLSKLADVYSTAQSNHSPHLYRFL